MMGQVVNPGSRYHRLRYSVRTTTCNKAERRRESYENER